MHRDLAVTGISTTWRQTTAIEVGSPSGEPADQFEPALAPGQLAVLDEDEAIIDPAVFVADIRREAARLGARFRFETPVTRVTAGEGRVGVAVGAEDLHAAAVVLATGARHIPGVPRTGGAAHILPGRGYAVDVTGGPALARPVRLLGRRIVVVPLHEGRIRVCGYLDLGTGKVRTDPAGDLLRTATTAIPALADATVVATHVGDRPCSPGGLPLIGAIPGQPGLWRAVGHGMWGLILGPVTGEIISDDILRAA